MSEANVPSFHSSSECPTAHVSRRNLDTSELDSDVRSNNLSRPKVSAESNETRMTPLDSDAFASPMTRPPTAVSTNNTPRLPTAQWTQRLGSLGLSGISILTPPSPSASASERASAISMARPGTQEDRSTRRHPAPMLEPDHTQHEHNARHNGYSHGLFGILQKATAPAKNSTANTSAETSQPTSHPTEAPSPRRRASSLPMVPTTRGAGGTWLQRSTTAIDGEAAATTGDAPRALSHLPPLRPPSSYFITGSKSGSSHASRRNASSHVVSPSTPAVRQTPNSSPQATPPPKMLATVTVADPEEEEENNNNNYSWWAAARRYAASKGDQVNAYLEKLVNPGAAAAATTADVQMAVSLAHSRCASLSQSEVSPNSSSNHNRVGGHHSQTASVSSGFDGAFSAVRRAPPSRWRASLTRGDASRASFEPLVSDPRQDSGANNSVMPLDVVVIDPAQEPFLWNDPSIQVPEVRVESRDAVNDSFNNVGDVSGSDEDDAPAEPNTYVVDLLSALRGYLNNPTEPFGHLVAAALASRSAEMPVRGFEVAAAEHNPFLVRMIVDSGTLEVQDEEAQRNVQDTVDELITAAEGELSPGIYEYLSSFFKMPFLRLSHGQYALLKRSGFEYIKLMFDHQHVLPDEPFHSLLVNESHVMHVFNFVFMVIQLLSIVFCTVTIAVVLAVWMKVDNNKRQSFGFYTLIVFGGGWALYLVFIVYAVRSRQDEQRYEPQKKGSGKVLIPSPYTAVVPVIPLFDIVCLVAYGMAVKQKRMILGHNIVASSRLSGAFYAVWFAFPQLITQSYFNNIQLSIDAQYRHRWPYTMLIVAVIAQWGIALLGYVGFLFTHDSIDGFGFACFNMPRVKHLLERHNAAAHILHYLTTFLLETNVYLVAANAINRPIPSPCGPYWNVVLALSAFSVFYILVIFFAITLTDASTVRISFTSVALLAVQVALCVCSERLQRTDCAACRHFFFRGTFVFGYLSWGAYFFMFLVWLVMMTQWFILCHHQLNLFPRVLWPYARRDDRFTKTKKSEESPADKAMPSQAAADSKDGAQTT